MFAYGGLTAATSFTLLQAYRLIPSESPVLLRACCRNLLHARNLKIIDCRHVNVDIVFGVSSHNGGIVAPPSDCHCMPYVILKLACVALQLPFRPRRIGQRVLAVRAR